MLSADKVFKNIELAGFFFYTGRVRSATQMPWPSVYILKYGYGASVNTILHFENHINIILIIIKQSDREQFFIRFRISHDFSHGAQHT